MIVESNTTKNILSKSSEYHIILLILLSLAFIMCLFFAETAYAADKHAEIPSEDTDVSADISEYASGNNENVQVSVSPDKNISAAYENKKTVIWWNEVEGADAYRISFRIGMDGEYRELAIVSSTYYIHKYSDLDNKIKRRICDGYRYIDVTENPIMYRVEPLQKIEKNVKNVRRHGKKRRTEIFEIIADSSKTMEICNFESPIIMSVSKANTYAEVKWSVVKNAVAYEVYAGSIAHGKIEWHQVDTVRPGEYDSEQATMECGVSVGNSDTYYKVRSIFRVNGQKCYSKFSKKFHYERDKFKPLNILYIGDSLTFGSPYYKQSNIHIFSYPNLIADMTGTDFLNASIPGITYGKKRHTKRCPGLVEIVADSLAVGEKMNYEKYSHPGRLNDNDKYQTFSDFDVVVMAAGDNDYGLAVPPGDLDSDSVFTMNGAVNRIMNYIEEGNRRRTAEGEKPTKVIFPQIIFGYRHAGRDVSRHSSHNSLGLTLSDYQVELNGIADKYRKRGMKVYCFDTASIVNEKNYAVSTVDHLHMSKKTDKEYAEKLMNFMVDKKVLQEDEMHRILSMSNYKETDAFHMNFYL